MPYPVYSTTFIVATDSGIWHGYVVPAGHRAVLKSVDIVSITGNNGWCHVQVGGHYVYLRQFPGSPAAVHGDLFCVARAGEAIELLNQTNVMHASVSGYLLTEVEGAVQALSDPYEQPAAAPEGFRV